MKKIIYAFFCLLSLTIVNAQSINNKNCTINKSDLIKSNFDGFSIYKQLRKNKDSIFSKNFIADTDNYFDLTAIKLSKRKYRIIIVEYSPENKTSCKATIYKYNIKSKKIYLERLSYSMTWGCIAIPINFDWDKELKYSKFIDKPVSIRLFNEMVFNK